MVAGEAKSAKAQAAARQSDSVSGVGLRTERRLVVAIPDIHFPFENKRTLRAVVDLVAEVQPDAVVQLGDLLDLYSSSRYPRSHNIMTPRDEKREGRARAVAFWDAIRQAAPGAECWQLLGNHDLRSFKRTLERLPELEDEVWSSLRTLMTFDGVRLWEDSRMPLQIDDVAYEHGALKHGQHLGENGMNTVCAHSHVGGTVHRGGAWELNAGFLGDPDAQCFDYVRSRLVAQKTTQGVGVVDSYGPRFIPL